MPRLRAGPCPTSCAATVVPPQPAEILLALYRKRFLARLNAAPSAAAAPSTSASAGPGSASAATASGHTGPAPGQQQGAGGAQADFSRPAFAVAALQLTAAKAGGGKGKVSTPREGAPSCGAHEAATGHQVPGSASRRVPHPWSTPLTRSTQAHKLDVRKVLQQLGIPAAHYQSVCDSIKELCAAELGLDAAPAPSTSAGAGGEQQGEGAPADAASGVAAEGAAQQPPRKGRKRVAEGDAGRGEGGGGAAGRGGKRRGRKARAGSGGEGEGLDGEGLGGLEGEAVGEEAEEAWEVLGRAGEQERGGAKRSRRSGR